MVKTSNLKKRSSRKRLSCTSFSRSRLVAAMSLALTVSNRVPPTLVNCRVSRKVRSFTWRLSGMSPISLRNIVPPSASSSNPRFGPLDPVKAPDSYPKSSDSANSGDRAAQLTEKKGPRARLD